MITRNHSNSYSLVTALVLYVSKLTVLNCIIILNIDLKKMYFQAGVENKPTVFLFTDAQVLDESFLEDINNMLSSGEVPILYKSDEFEEVKQELLEVAKQEGIAESTQVNYK